MKKMLSTNLNHIQGKGYDKNYEKSNNNIIVKVDYKKLHFNNLKSSK